MQICTRPKNDAAMESIGFAQNNLVIDERR